MHKLILNPNISVGPFVFGVEQKEKIKYLHTYPLYLNYRACSTINDFDTSLNVLNFPSKFSGTKP